MADFKADIAEASQDLKTIEDFVNLPAGSAVKPRLLPSVDVGTLAGIRNAIFENGGLPATPFKTKALMTASALANDKYAMVTDGGVDNGLYTKTAGTWVKSSYDPLAQAKGYTDAVSIAKGSYEIVGTNNTLPLRRNTEVASRYVEGAYQYYYATAGLKNTVILPCDADTAYTVLTYGDNRDIAVVLATSSNTNIINSEKANGFVFPNITTGRTTAQQAPVVYSFTITSGSNDKSLVVSVTGDFMLFKGAYNVGMVADVYNSTAKQLKQHNVDNLTVQQINTPMFGKSLNKNIFGGYVYGLAPSALSFIYTNIGMDVPLGFGATYNSADTNTAKTVLGIANVKEGSTYTISKEFSDYFAVGLIPIGTKISNGFIGRLIHMDTGVRSFTFTVPVGYDRVIMYLSKDKQEPKVQVELGAKATNYQPTGVVFSGNESQTPPLDVDIIATDNKYIDLKSNGDYFVRAAGLGGAFDVTPEQLLAKYYDDLVTDFPQYVTKNVLGKDATGTYDIHEFVFEPDNWEQKIVITSGMHPTERIPPVALGILLNEIYRKPEKHAGLSYLRNKVKIVVIPIINTWGHNQLVRKAPEHYLNSNNINISRNFSERWDVLDQQSVYDRKGTAPFSEAEAVIMRDLYIREKDDLAFTMDTHTGENWEADTLLYWLQEDSFLRPSLASTVSMKSDAIRTIKGNNAPLIVTAHETQRALNLYWLWSVLGIPSAVVEYGTGSSFPYSSEQSQHYVNQLFNYIHYALKERLYDKRMQAVKNEHNKPFVSLYSTLTAHNEVLNYKWTAAQLNTNLYDKLGMVKTTVNSSAVYTHTPSYYDKTVLLVSGAVTTEKKGVTVLAFACHKLMTDSNPNLVGFKNNVRFIVAPLATAATVTAILAANTVDLVMEVRGTDTGTNPASYSNYQVTHKLGAFTGFGANIAKIANKYGSTINANVAKTDGGLVSSSIATVVNVPYQSHYFSKNLLPPKVIPEEAQFVDYGYNAKEMACCADLLFNSLASYIK